MAYLLDSNVFIESKNLYYRFGTCPAFWDWIERAHQEGLAFSIDAVRNDLNVGNDDLTVWVAARGPHFFLSADAQTGVAATAVSVWVNAQQFHAGAIATFFASSDYLLIAHALAHGFTVVTRETPDPNCRRRVKIPDVCQAVGVPFMNHFEMLEIEGAVFNL
jgi:hypothetical protein